MKKTVLLLLSLLPTATLHPTAALGWGDMKRIEKQIVAPVFPDVEFFVGDFGAAGNGVNDDRPAIQAAIDSCSNRGGGHVVLPSGRYFSRGPIVLKNNVDLHISKGAELVFSADERDYLPVVLTRWEGTELFNYSPLIYARNMQNIAITGHGTINGQGSKNFATWKPRQKADQQALRKQGREGTPLHERIYGEGHWLRPAMLELVSCSGILIENIRIIDAPFWSIHPLCCNNVIVRGVTVDSTNLNNDGCDPESCRNVLIEDCYFHTGDDAIAIKSGRDNEAWRIGQPTENIIIRRCTFDTEINGLCIGSEISGGVRNVFAEDICILRASHGLYFKSNLDRGGYIEESGFAGFGSTESIGRWSNSSPTTNPKARRIIRPASAISSSNGSMRTKCWVSVSISKDSNGYPCAMSSSVISKSTKRKHPSTSAIPKTSC